MKLTNVLCIFIILFAGHIGGCNYVSGVENAKQVADSFFEDRFEMAGLAVMISIPKCSGITPMPENGGILKNWWIYHWESCNRIPLFPGSCGINYPPVNFRGHLPFWFLKPNMKKDRGMKSLRCSSEVGGLSLRLLDIKSIPSKLMRWS